MKQFLYSILAVLLCIVVVGGAVYVANASTSSSQGTIIQDSGTGTGTTDDPGMD